MCHPLSRAPRTRRLGACLVLGLAWLVIASPRAHAGCNIIPTAAKQLPSVGAVTLHSGGVPTGTGVVASGYVDRAVAGPGELVTVRAPLGCSPAQLGFARPVDPNPNMVRLIFHSPNGQINEATADPATVKPIKCGGARCKGLRFAIPDTSGVVPGGLTGPAEIVIERTIFSTTFVVARVFELFQGTRSCDSDRWAPDGVFGTFTVLPAANALVEGDASANPSFLGAVDGVGNLLLPMDFRAVLQAEAGESVATVLKVVSANAAILSALQDPATDSDDLRSFNARGRPIPPVLRLVTDPANPGEPAFVGTTDVLASVVRVAPVGGLQYADLMRSGIGAVEIFGASVSVQSAAPLKSVRSSGEILAVGSDEMLRGDLNGDGDVTDLVVEITEVETGIVNNTMMALADAGASNPKPVIASAGDLVVFLQSEARSGTPCGTPPCPGTDLNGDGSAGNAVLRVFRGANDPLTLGSTLVTADASLVLDGQALVASTGGTGDEFVFFRRREADESTTTIDGTSNGALPVDAVRSPAIARDAEVVASVFNVYFVSPADQIGYGFGFVAPVVGVASDAGVNNPVTAFADGASLNPSMDDAGLSVAYDSTATNLEFPASSGTRQIYITDLPSVPNGAGFAGFDLPDALFMVSRNRSSLSEGNAPSYEPSMSGDGTQIAFTSEATNLLVGTSDTNGLADVYVYERTPADAIVRVSLGPGGTTEADGASSEPALSTTGRYVAFKSLATDLGPADTNGVSDVYLADRDADADGIFDEPGTLATTRVSLSSTGAGANAASSAPAISGNGRIVAFVSAATNLVAGDGNAAADVFVRDLDSGLTERVSISSAAAEGNGPSFQPALSRDGRFVVFASDASNLVPSDSNGVTDVFRFDRLTRTTERLTVDAAGVQANGASSAPSIDADASVLLFQSDATNLLASGDIHPAETDVFWRQQTGGVDLNGDADTLDVALQALAAGGTSGTSALVSAGQEAGAVSVAAGVALYVGPAAAVSLWNPYIPSIPSINPSNLGVAGRAVALSEAAACAVSTGDELFATTWALATIPGGRLESTGMHTSSDAVAALGSRCIFLRSEALEAAGGSGCGPTVPSGGCDLNGDGDALDHVLHSYDTATATAVSSGWSAEDFRADADNPDVVAFRTAEASEAGSSVRRPECTEVAGSSVACDLNGDGDDLDLVMQVYDLADDEVVNLERAAIACTFDACNAFELYRVRADDTVSFLGREVDQAVGHGCLLTSPPAGCDLDGDGLGSGVVVHVVKFAPGASGALEVKASQVLPAETEAKSSFFPETVVDQTVAMIGKSECQAARYGCCGVDSTEPVCAVASFGTTFSYEAGGCASVFDTDPAPTGSNPDDVAGSLDCVTLREWIVGDSDRGASGEKAGDGILDIATNGVDDVSPEVPDPDQADADGDGLGDVVDPDDASPLPAELGCDLDGNGQVDRLDVDLIVEAIGQEADGLPEIGWDRRDRHPDGLITSFDAALCSVDCSYADCVEEDPSPPSSGCGLLGVEALLPFAWLLRRRRRGWAWEIRAVFRGGVR